MIYHLVFLLMFFMSHLIPLYHCIKNTIWIIKEIELLKNSSIQINFDCPP